MKLDKYGMSFQIHQVAEACKVTSTKNGEVAELMAILALLVAVVKLFWRLIWQ